ncbi:nuclear transport factor 2 family protein [Qaidamihabitans albus]|uniref:nuclear transport factor 2 family protein n=1 Tax=Qaidamihabitans albus TaxID=2795733 RepID=UPI0018F25803|nr:nuclear transport factor 2 family protein [Qaidamihabitans albus]
MGKDWAPVHEWHRAVNQRDIGAARRIADPDIEIGGPKGTRVGADHLVDWIHHAGIRLQAVAWHPIDEHRVVVEQDATWPDNPGADPGAAPVRTATLFKVAGGRVTSALRYDDGVHAALRAAQDS